VFLEKSVALSSIEQSFLSRFVVFEMGYHSDESNHNIQGLLVKEVKQKLKPLLVLPLLKSLSSELQSINKLYSYCCGVNMKISYESMVIKFFATYCIVKS